MMLRLIASPACQVKRGIDRVTMESGENIVGSTDEEVEISMGVLVGGIVATGP